jgi:phosphotransferase system HPr-like phosphotransfer protein
VNPAVFPEIKQIVRGIHYRDARKLVEKVLTFSTEAEIFCEAENFYLKNITLEK